MVSSHALTTLNWVCSVQWFWKKAGKNWKYDFRTLKWPKCQISRNPLKHLREGPGWISLVEKHSVVIVLMFVWCQDGFFWILRHLPLPSQLFPCYPLRFWDFWSETLSQRGLEGSLGISFDWKSAWKTSRWCLADSWVVLWSSKTFLLWQLLFAMYI